MLRQAVLLGWAATRLLGAPPEPPKPVAILREATGFERFCSSLRRREELTYLGSDLFQGEHTSVPEDYFKYSRSIKQIQVGQTSFTLVFERKPMRRTWTYTSADAPADQSDYPAYVNRIGFKDEKGDLQVLLATYSDLLPKELEAPLISFPVPMTRAAYGHDGDPFEKPADFKVGFQEDALVWVYEGMEPQGLHREFPLGVAPKYPIIKGSSLASYLALGILKDKPIAFARKLNDQGLVVDTATAAQMSFQESLEEARKLWQESRQDPKTLRGSSRVPTARGLSVNGFNQKFQVGAGERVPMKMAQTAVLDLPVAEPLRPWDYVYAGEHGDGERFILLDFDDPFNTYSKVYLAFYENEPFPRIALSHRDIVGVTGGRSLSGAQWYRVRADIEKRPPENWRSSDHPGSMVMQLLRKIDSGVDPAGRCLNPLNAGGLSRARDVLEPREETRKRTIRRTWVLPNAINALRVAPAGQSEHPGAGSAPR